MGILVGGMSFSCWLPYDQIACRACRGKGEISGWLSGGEECTVCKRRGFLPAESASSEDDSASEETLSYPGGYRVVREQGCVSRVQGLCLSRYFVLPFLFACLFAFFYVISVYTRHG